MRLTARWRAGFGCARTEPHNSPRAHPISLGRQSECRMLDVTNPQEAPAAAVIGPGVHSSPRAGPVPTRKELAARGFAVRRCLERGWTLWHLECLRYAVPRPLRTAAENPRFVTYRAAALYAPTLRATREHDARLEDLTRQLAAHLKADDPFEDGTRQQRAAELLALLAVTPDVFEPRLAPRYEVLVPIADIVVATFSFPSDDHREHVNARRAAAQVAGAYGDVTYTELVREGFRRDVGPQDGPWK
jgi:hypothetical protein